MNHAAPQSLLLRRGAEERHACFVVVEANALDSPAASPEAMLSGAEQAQFAALRFAPKRISFLLGRLAAKRALGVLLNEADLRAIDIYNGVFGQPLVRHARAGGIDVTVSHSYGVAVALAFPAQWPIGIDLEMVPAQSVDTVLAELGASAAEQAWIDAGAPDRMTACGVLWSAREALGKSMKIGLNCPLGVLALGALAAAGSVAAGRAPARSAAWTGTYLHFPQSRCVSQTDSGRVLSMAAPGEITFDSWPQLR